MARLTLSDLKSKGLELTKDEAAEIAPLIREVSHNGGFDASVVFEGDDNVDENPGFPGNNYDEISKGEPTGENIVTEIDNSVTETEATTEENSGDENQDSETTDSTEETGDGTSTEEAKAEHWKTKAKRLKDSGLMEYTITQDDVDKSIYTGNVGDVIEIPIQSTGADQTTDNTQQ